MSMGAIERDLEANINPHPEGVPEQVGVDAQGRRWRRQKCGPHMFALQLLLTTTTIFTAYTAGERKHEIGIFLPIALGTVNFILSQVQAC